MNGDWYHFDDSAAGVAKSIGEAMGDHVQLPIAGDRGFVVFGTQYSVAILATAASSDRTVAFT